MHITSDASILPTFGPMGAPSADSVFGFLGTCSFERDSVLTKQGESPSRVYWIESGVVKKVCLQPDGSEVITGLRTTGWIVDAEASLVRSPQRSTAIAVSRLGPAHQ
jgi:hypothetical protein